MKLRYKFHFKCQVIVQKSLRFFEKTNNCDEKIYRRHVEKKYIKFNTSKYVVFVLIIKKSNDDFYVCVNYRVFNVFIIKNRNALLLIKNTLIRLCSIKYYNKFDIIIAFNEIRMRQKNKKKSRFSSNMNFSNTLLCFFIYATRLKFFNRLSTLFYTNI